MEERAFRPTALTLAEAALMMRSAVKDKSYRATPLGLEVAHFMRWFRNEYGATVENSARLRGDPREARDRSRGFGACRLRTADRHNPPPRVH
jgi:hypothetical protein